MKNYFSTFKILTSVVPLVCASFGATMALAAEYPVPGRLDGTTAFVHEKDTPKKATKSHPEWFRGTGKNGIADENAKYYYHELIGPNLPAPGFQNEQVYFGPLVMQTGYTYPAHNHPAPEIYYVIEGEADWYVDDERMHVTPGSMIYHRPFAVHGWKVTSEKPLRVVWLWWAEEDKAVLNSSAKMVNPDLASKAETALPYAVPLPTVRKKQ